MTRFAAGRKQIPAFLLAMGLACATWLSPMAALAQYVPPPGTITTQGRGEVKVKPDALSVTVMVESKNTTLAAARTDNNRKMQAIVNALKDLNIPNLKLETQGVQVYPIQGEYQKDKLPKVIGYNVNNRLNVSVINASPDNLGEYGSRIVDTALNAGANHVSNLNFYLSDMSAARAKALELAVKDAKNNAEAMARAADISLTGLYSLEGSPQFGGYPPQPVAMFSRKAEAASADMGSVPVETGETTITSDVTARFKF